MIHIRTYDPSDEDAVIALWSAADIARPWLDLRAEINEKLKRDPELFLVAVDEGAIVGALMGAYDGRRGWVYHLAVAPDRQREGIGRTLMAEIEIAMARIGVEKINLQVRTGNLGVRGFYEKLGYGDDQVIGLGKWIKKAERGEL